MEGSKPTKIRRGWRTLAFIVSPLAVAAIWCRFVDQEDFAAFVLGVLFSTLFGGVVLVRFLLKKSEQKHPFINASLIFGSTVAGIVVVFIAGSLGTLAIFGDSDEASWGFTLCFMMVAPIAILTGLVVAIRKFVRHRRARNFAEQPRVA